MDLNINVPSASGQTARVVAGMSKRGQQSFANAAARQGIATPIPGSVTGRSLASGSRARPSANSIASEGFGRFNRSASNAAVSMAGAPLPTSRIGSSSAYRGYGMAMGELAQPSRIPHHPRHHSVENLMGLNSQRAPANHQLVLYRESQRGALQAVGNGQLVPWAGGSQCGGSRTSLNNRLAPVPGSRASVRGSQRAVAPARGVLGAIAEENNTVVAAACNGALNLNLVVVNANNNTDRQSRPRSRTEAGDSGRQYRRPRSWHVRYGGNYWWF